MNYTFMRFPNFRDKAVTLSYDDGIVYDEKLIEIISKYGLKSTFNISSGLFGMNDQHLTKDSALKLYKDSGNEVAAHGKQHLSLAELSYAVAVNDILNDRIELENLFATIINGMAYANGSFNDDVVNAIKTCGIKYARTTISTEKFNIPTDWLRLKPTCHHNNPRLMELAKKFIEEEPHWYYWSRNPKLFYLWGHSYEFNDNKNWNILEEFSEYIGNREDVWYATNIEIYNYVKAFDSLVFSADGKMIENPSALDVYINYFDKEYIINSGETILI